MRPVLTLLATALLLGACSPGVERLNCSDSTAIRFAEYDPRTQILNMGFRTSGKTYTFEGVPVVVWEAWKAAPSKGRFFNSEIKGRYQRE